MEKRLKREDASDNETPPQKPLCVFGAISDVQYGDIENGHSFTGIARHYRYAKDCLKQAIDQWNADSDISFAIHLGDLIDGKNKHNSEVAMTTILKEFSHFSKRSLHLVGNHDLYHIQREKLAPLLSFPHESNFWYDFSPHEKVRFVCLDSYDISMWGISDTHPHHKIAKDLLESKNPNSDKNSPTSLRGSNRRFVAFNGGVSSKQLQWLQKTLSDAHSASQIVIVCSHVPLHPDAGDTIATLWNYDEVLSVISKYSSVKMILSGHDHDGGYLLHKNVHHYVFPGVIEQPPPQNAFAKMEIYHDRVKIIGNGIIKSEELVFL